MREPDGQETELPGALGQGRAQSLRYWGSLSLNGVALILLYDLHHWAIFGGIRRDRAGPCPPGGDMREPDGQETELPGALGQGRAQSLRYWGSLFLNGVALLPLYDLHHWAIFGGIA